jgi:hypothetical protein
LLIALFPVVESVTTCAFTAGIITVDVTKANAAIEKKRFIVLPPKMISNSTTAIFSNYPQLLFWVV